MSLRMIETAGKLRNPETHCALCGRKYGRAIRTEEHIFPLWLQHRFGLLTKTVNIPNLITKRYNSVKMPICQLCNNERFSQLESVISNAISVVDKSRERLANVPDVDIAIWLGKIFFLLCRKSGTHEDFLLRDAPEKDTILPKALQPGLNYLAVILNAYALKKGFYSCFLYDAPTVESYDFPFSLYRFQIDTRAEREEYDYSDFPAGLGVAIRLNDAGVICLFDGGLHRRFLSARYSFIGTNRLHPLQFRELSALMYYDLTILDDATASVQYYWNRRLNSVIAEYKFPRFWNPFRMDNHDPTRLRGLVSRYTFLNPDDLKGDVPSEVRSSLFNPDGTLFHYPVTESDHASLPVEVRKLRPLDIGRKNRVRDTVRSS